LPELFNEIVRIAGHQVGPSAGGNYDRQVFVGSNLFVCWVGAHCA
jgi:hypothetical protein